MFLSPKVDQSLHLLNISQ